LIRWYDQRKPKNSEDTPVTHNRSTSVPRRRLADDTVGLDYSDLTAFIPSEIEVNPASNHQEFATSSLNVEFPTQIQERLLNNLQDVVLKLRSLRLSLAADLDLSFGYDILPGDRRDQAEHLHSDGIGEGAFTSVVL
jgi:hypothetical protein